MKCLLRFMARVFDLLTRSLKGVGVVPSKITGLLPSSHKDMFFQVNTAYPQSISRCLVQSDNDQSNVCLLNQHICDNVGGAS